jgi:hypothetical protein
MDKRKFQLSEIKAQSSLPKHAITISLADALKSRKTQEYQIMMQHMLYGS